MVISVYSYKCKDIYLEMGVKEMGKFDCIL